MQTCRSGEPLCPPAVRRNPEPQGGTPGASGRELDKEGTYEIRVEVHLGESWSQCFDGWDIKHKGENTTVLTGRVADQPALHGLLVKIRHLGLPLVSVNCVKPNKGEVPEQLI